MTSIRRLRVTRPFFRSSIGRPKRLRAAGRAAIGLARAAVSTVTPEDRALTVADIRRARGVAFNREELTRRIDELGDLRLSTLTRHRALVELYHAFAPEPYVLAPFPDSSKITLAERQVRVQAVIFDRRQKQVVASIDRHLQLDARRISHELLTIQQEYRGVGLSLTLLEQAFPIYRQLGLRYVDVHAALETGRWHWARLGFDFANPAERTLVLGWALLALRGLGHPPLPADSPARRLAQLGSAGGEVASLEDVWTAVSKQVQELRVTDPQSAILTSLIPALDHRANRTDRMSILDPQRMQAIADGNALEPTHAIALGKAIMLLGPDWFGEFALADPAAEAAFEQEAARRRKRTG